MIDEKQFNTLSKQLGKQSSKSYNDQKALIKKVLSGREMHCKSCKQLIIAFLPENEPATGEGSQSGIRCNKGCTDISLDFA